MTVDKNLKKVGIKQPKAYYKKKQETLTALKKRIKERKKELSDWIESDGSDATDNEMLQHNFLVDIENELKKLETEQSDNELLTELGNAIRAGKVKIDWIEDCEEYNEEEDIKGLYTDTFYLSLIGMDENKHGKERQTLYKLFPSRKERKEKKAGSWRKEEGWTKELSGERKEIERRELELIKDKNHGKN